MNVSDNPFTQDPESCSAALNVYVDDNNSLTVRPRVESTGIPLLYSKEDKESSTATCLATFKITGGWFTIEKDETKTPSIYGSIRTDGGAKDPVVKKMIKFAGSSVKNIVNENGVYDVYENGNIITGDGTLYLLDGDELKKIERASDENFYWGFVGENYSGKLSEQYAPLVKSMYDPLTSTYSSFQAYNALSKKYRVGYKTYDDFTDFSSDIFLGKKATLHASDGSEYSTEKLTSINCITNFTKFDKQFDGLACSKDMKAIYTIESGTKAVVYSKDYGRTFETFYYKDENSEVLRPLYATKITCNGDGSVVYVITQPKDYKLCKIVNNVMLSTKIPLNDKQFSTTYENIDYSFKFYYVTDFGEVDCINTLVIKTNDDGSVLSMCGEARNIKDSGYPIWYGVGLFYTNNLSTLHKDIYINTIFLTDTDHPLLTERTIECSFNDDCVLLRIPKKVALQNITTRTNKTSGEVKTTINSTTYWKSTAIVVYDTTLAHQYGVIEKLTEVDDEWETDTDTFVKTRDTKLDPITCFYYNNTICVPYLYAGGWLYCYYFYINQHKKTSDGYGTLITQPAGNFVFEVSGFTSPDFDSIHIMSMNNALYCFLYEYYRGTKVCSLSFTYSENDDGTRLYLDETKTSETVVHPLSDGGGSLYLYDAGGGDSPYRITTSDSNTFNSSQGLIYYLDSTTKKLMSNNAYSKDIDWLTIEYDDYVSDYANINLAQFYKFFDNRLWLGGYKNYIAHSGYDENGQPRLDYFPESGVFKVGNDTTPTDAISDFTGFNIVSDNVLAAYKRNRLYLFTQTTLGGDSGVSTYTYTEVKAEQGNEAIGQPINAPLTSLPFQINRDGIFALTSLTNVYTADKVATLYSQPINSKLELEDLSKLKTVKHKYWVFFVFPDEDTNRTHIYAYDDRYSYWFYWVVPMQIVSIYSDENLMLVGTDGVLRAFKTSDIIQNYNATDNISSIETTYYDVTPTHSQKIIPWYWVSQILPLGTISYNKHVSKTTFIMADSDSTDGYAFNYSVKAWRKSTPVAKSSEASGFVYSVQSTTKRTNFNKINFAQITLTNIDLTDNVLEYKDYDEYTSSIDVTNQKIKLIGLSMKYRIMEV